MNSSLLFRLFSDKFVKFLEWRGFLISTKLSYGVYLVQFAVFHFNVGRVRSSSHFGIIKSVVNIDRPMTRNVRTVNIYAAFFRWTQTNCCGLSLRHRSWPCSSIIHSAIWKSWFLIARKHPRWKSRGWTWTIMNSARRKFRKTGSRIFWWTSMKHSRRAKRGFKTNCSNQPLSAHTNKQHN